MVFEQKFAFSLAVSVDMRHFDIDLVRFYRTKILRSTLINSFFNILREYFLTSLG